MKTPTINLRDTSLVRAAAFSKALGHPVRIAILRFLAENETCICGDITDVLPLAQSTVSQHLKALKQAGLIKGTVEGVKTCYCLNPDGIDELQKLLTNLTGKLQNKNLNNCC